MNATGSARWKFGRKLALAISPLLVAAGCGSDEPSRPPQIRPIKTLVVAAGDENRTRIFPGKVEASKRVELAFQVPGLLVELPVVEGQKVTKGELIAQLRSDEFQARLTTLQGQLDRERAALRALVAGDRPEQRLRLEAQVRAAEARLANARIEFDRSSRLVQTRAIPRSDFDLSDTTYRVAQEDYNAARQMLEKGTMAREEDIEAQEAEVRGLEGRVVEANIQLERHNAARSLRRCDCSAVCRTESERPREGAGRQVPGRGRD